MPILHECMCTVHVLTHISKGKSTVRFKTLNCSLVKKYRKTSRATSNVGYQTNVVSESASSSALEGLEHNLFIYFAHNYLFIYSFIYFVS